jgi:hypothetical protein
MKTVLPHQLTVKPPSGSWNAKKMVISDNTVPVHIQMSVSHFQAKAEYENTDRNPSPRP